MSGLHEGATCTECGFTPSTHTHAEGCSRSTARGLRDQTAAAIGDHEGWQRPDQSWECACGQTFGIKLKHSEHVADAVLALLTEEWAIIGSDKHGAPVRMEMGDERGAREHLAYLQGSAPRPVQLERRWVGGWSVVAGEQP